MKMTLFIRSSLSLSHLRFGLKRVWLYSPKANIIIDRLARQMLSVVLLFMQFLNSYMVGYLFCAIPNWARWNFTDSRKHEIAVYGHQTQTISRDCHLPYIFEIRHLWFGFYVCVCVCLCLAVVGIIRQAYTIWKQN